MIITKKPLSMAEAKEFIGKDEEKNTAVKNFIKKFSKLTPEEAKEIRKKVEDIGSINIREEHVVKIIDIFPENADDLNKIFSGSQLEEEEAKKVLEIIKEYK